MASSGPIDDGAALWRSLAERAGLQPDTYDKDLEVDVRRRLGLGLRGPIGDALARRAVPAADVLDAVLASLQPFTGMLADLLRLYEQVSATSASGENLRIEYDFAADTQKFGFDLAWFRETTRRFSVVTESIPWITASAAQLWDLEGALRTEQAWMHEVSAAEPLFAMYRNGGRWPVQLPALPSTGFPELDRVLEQTLDIADRVLQASRQYSTGPAELRGIDNVSGHFEGDADPTAASLMVLRQVHSDHWLAAVVNGAHHLAASATAGATDPDIVHRLMGALAQIPRREVLVRRRVEELLDILNLPVWKRRHELYSAWLLTLIVEGLPPGGVTIHVVDGKLAFSFAGTHVASVESGLGRLELWAELRHPYATPIGRGRRRAIQPDYTLSKPPISRDESAVLVVEAKQYRRGSRSNFLKALIDYVGGHRKACVLLANYGTMPQSVIRGAPLEARPFGGVHPGNKQACDEFKEAIRKVVPPAATSPSVSSSEDVSADPDLRAVVFLHWGRGGDLDLHLVDTDSRTVASYQTIDIQAVDAPVRLWNDDLAAPGIEGAQISVSAGPVELWVHRFSGTERIADCRATIHIRTRDGAVINLRCPDSVGDAGWWYVGVLETDGSFRGVGVGRDSLELP
jgi:hypothetical protein